MTREAKLAADIYEKIEDEKVRFFWLKLGESLAKSGVIPQLVASDQQQQHGETPLGEKLRA